MKIDKYICLHCLEDVDRYEKMVNELNKIGLLNDCFITEFVKLNTNIIIGNKIESLHSFYYDNIRASNENIYGAVFSCSYNWLLLIKWAYSKGYNNIICFEDDIWFNCTKEEYYDYLNEIPKNADMCLLGYGISNGYSQQMTPEEIYNLSLKLGVKYLRYNKDLHFYGTHGVYFNRRGMDYYINYMENKLRPADLIWTEDNLDMFEKLNVYYANKSIVGSNSTGKSSINNV